MKNQPIYRKVICNLSQKNSGFTLTELLVAVIITGVLVAGTGAGLNTILQANARSEQETLRRKQGNRALNFIIEEVKMAESISNNPTNPTEDDPDPSDFDQSSPNPSASDQTEVLVLTIPNLDENVVYSIATPDDSTLLQGPRIIYRWGPDFEDNGDYSNPENSSEWDNNALIDLVSEESGNCDSGTQFPESNAEGFYICLQGTRNAEIFIRSDIKSDINDTKTITVRTRAFARSSNE